MYVVIGGGIDGGMTCNWILTFLHFYTSSFKFI